MEDGTTVCRGGLTTSADSTTCRRLNGSGDAGVLRIPVVLFSNTHFFFPPPPLHPHNSDQTGDGKDRYHGSIVFTSTMIVVKIAVNTCNEENNTNNRNLSSDDGTVREVAAFTDSVDAVTGFHMWVSDAPRHTLFYRLELLGGAHSVFFQIDEARVGSPPLCTADNTGDVAAEGLVPWWAHRVEEFIGQNIDTCVLPRENDNNSRDPSDMSFEGSTIDWGGLLASAVEQLNSAKGSACCCAEAQNVCGWSLPVMYVSALPPPPTPPAVVGTESPIATIAKNSVAEWEAQRLNCTQAAFTARIALIHDEYVKREDLLLQWMSEFLPAEVGVRKGVNSGIAAASLSLRGQASVEENQHECGGDGLGITDEVMQLLAEEENVARMKLVKYTASVQQGSHGRVAPQTQEA
ncbi:hypothetical protein DQ04_00521080 [Trypanosoma grayi]|uniref:hypothetical protein n=1 Tax=Trypanosoma grayi TaxID=71804 RepID=UPI0004F41F4C|nr:hypothetical protein DQ04_00521080 [Trypanosoma grayi]KEG14323.1 hypothetical protein DQ04_00521080 [Trypanosoma grayi]